MRRGEVFIVTINPEYGFGDIETATPQAVVPAHSTLYYDVEMLGFTKVKEVYNMEPEGKLEYAAKRKREGKAYFRAGKYSRAALRYNMYEVMDHGSKVQFLSKILFVKVRAIHKDAENKKAGFNPRPYFRLFINLVLDLGRPDSQVLTTLQMLFLLYSLLKFLNLVKLEDGSLVAKSPDEVVEFLVSDGDLCPAIEKTVFTTSKGEQAILRVQPRYAFGALGRSARDGLSAVPSNADVNITLT